MKERLSLLRNAAIVTAASYFESVIGLLLGIFIARTLGPTRYGYYAFAVWVCGSLITASNHGLTTTSIKFIAEARGAGQPALAAALAYRLLRLQRFSSLLVLGAFIVGALLRPPEEWRGLLVPMIGLVVAGTWGRAGFWMLEAIGKGYERFETGSIAIAVAAVCNLVLVGLCAWLDGGLAGFFSIYVFSGLVANVVARIMLRRLQVRPQAGAIAAEVDSRFRRHLTLTGLLMLLFLASNRTVETLALKQFSTPEALGFFAIAGTLTKGAVDLLTGGMSSILQPAMSRAYGRGGQASLPTMLSESIRFYWAIGLMMAGYAFTVVGGAVRFLYGAKYEAAIPAVIVTLVVAGLSACGGAINAAQTTADRQADRVRITLLTLAFNIVAGLALVPPFGLEGALACLAATRLVWLLVAWIYLRLRIVEARLPWRPMLRLALAADLATLLGIGAGRLLPLRFGWIAAGAVFTVAYFAFSLLLRAWRAPDFELAASILGRAGRHGRAAAARVLAWKGRYAIGH